MSGGGIITVVTSTVAADSVPLEQTPGLYAAIAAGVSAAVAIYTARQALRSRRRDADVALLNLYNKVAEGAVRNARSRIWRWRSAPTQGRVALVHSEYFELVWAIELVYETLAAHHIRPASARRVLGFHLG